LVTGTYDNDNEREENVRFHDELIPFIITCAQMAPNGEQNNRVILYLFGNPFDERRRPKRNRFGIRQIGSLGCLVIR